MKNFLVYALPVAATVALSAFCMSLYRDFDFQRSTGLSHSQFLDTKKQCEELFNEPCRLYGGFAPESRFPDYEKPQANPSRMRSSL